MMVQEEGQEEVHPEQDLVGSLLEEYLKVYYATIQMGKWRQNLSQVSLTDDLEIFLRRVVVLVPVEDVGNHETGSE